MRLSGGRRARQRVQAPRGKKTRPTGAKVREALYAVLGPRIDSARVLDLFAGSGALGLEAMSRGASSVVFVDNDAAAVMAIRRNAVRLIPDAKAFRIMPMPALRALRTLRGTFDIVLVDPPYDRGASEELKLLMQRALLARDGIVVIEHATSAEVDIPASMEVVRRTRYGDTSLTFAAPRRMPDRSHSDRDESSRNGRVGVPPKRRPRRALRRR